MALETKLAQYLNHFPVVKRLVKSAYFRLWYLLKRKRYNVKCEGKLTQFPGFFGYYDKRCESPAGYVLCHVPAGKTTRSPDPEAPVELQLLKTNASGEPESVVWKASCTAYNWQQGTRAQWLTDDLFIYNDFAEGRYISRVISAEKASEVKTFDFPVQDSYGTQFFVSLNYRRLAAMRPDYGYFNLPALEAEALGPSDDDGLWLVDYESGNATLVVTLSQLAAFKPVSGLDTARQKINHVMISPDGRSCVFLHRYDQGTQRIDRLYRYDFESETLTLVSDLGMVSHCCWIDDTMLIGYVKGPGGVNGYWKINTVTGDFSAFAHDKLKRFGDGHPHVNGRYMVTDTYPDKARIQHLILCHLDTEDVKVVGEFKHGFSFQGESRCDLHPRISTDARAIYFDSVYTGERHMHKVDI